MTASGRAERTIHARPEAVIFDFDGPLTDTESTLKSWQFEWAQWGLELDASDFFANHGGDITEERYTQIGEAVGERFVAR